MRAYYDHLLLCGLYAVVIPTTGELVNAKLHVSDMLLFERIYSFYESGQKCYMTNADFAKQLGFSERTSVACINRLQRLGLVKVHIEHTFNGRIKDKRYIHIQHERLEQIITERKKAPFDCVLLQPLELYLSEKLNQLEEQPFKSLSNEEQLLLEEQILEVPPFESKQFEEVPPLKKKSHFEEATQERRQCEAPKEVKQECRRRKAPKEKFSM